jgi:uncharacterized membrane protein YgcG
MRRVLLLAGALALALGNNARAQGRSIRIRDFDAIIVVHTDGSLTVAENLTIGFTGKWNGIVRDLSLRHNTAQGRAERLDIGRIDVIGGNGAKPGPLRVEESYKDDGWTRSLRIYVPNADNADRQITIGYTVKNAIRFYFDSSSAGGFDELYWNVTGDGWTMPIDLARARVAFQFPDQIAPTRLAVYTGAMGSRAADAKIDTYKNSFGLTEASFTLTRSLSPNQGMTIGVGWPPGQIRTRPSEAPTVEPASPNGQGTYGPGTYGERAMRKRSPAVVQWSPLLIPFVVFFLAYKAWDKRGRDPKEGSIDVRYEPVKDASPAELGTLVDNTANMQDVTATLVDLAVRGFLRIEEITESHLFGLSKSTDYIIHILRNRSEWSQLKPHEISYLSALSNAAPDGESVKISELANKFYTSLPAIRNGIFESLVASGYYLKRPDKVRANWAALAFVTALALAAFGVYATNRMRGTFAIAALAIAAGASALIMGIFAGIMPARTISGARARENTLGFKEFLSRVEEDRYKRMITSPEMFERFLPYAMAFGVADKWAHAFQDMFREPPQWYVGGTGQFNAVTFSHSIDSMSSAAASSMASSPSSSGSGGGGSSGGGSGGGGGSGF